jgi:hypothetical protein
MTQAPKAAAAATASPSTRAHLTDAYFFDERRGDLRDQGADPGRTSRRRGRGEHRGGRHHPAEIALLTQGTTVGPMRDPPQAAQGRHRRHRCFRDIVEIRDGTKPDPWTPMSTSRRLYPRRDRSR